jgi:hypothetical protein
MLLLMVLVSIFFSAVEAQPDSTWYQPDSSESIREYHDNWSRIKFRTGKRNGDNGSFLTLINWPGFDSTYFKIDLGIDPDLIEFCGDTTIINGPYFDAMIYTKSNKTLEWEILLYTRPQNQWSWSFPFQYENLDFYFQDSSSFEPATCFRADSVWYSYAVYHSRWFDGIYKTGKAFHIYRPKAWDNAGDTTWLDLSIDTTAKLITISGDREWFRDAVYPVKVDPTMGYDQIGASEANSIGDEVHCFYLTPDTTGAGTTDSCFIYGRAGGFASLALYQYSDVPSNCDLVAFSDSFQFETSGTASWKGTGFSTSLSANTGYITAFMIDTFTGRINYDGVDWGDERIVPERNNLNDWPDDLTNAVNGGRRYSAYIKYSTDNPGGFRARRRIILQNIIKGNM